MAMALTTKQQRFVEEYIIDFNAAAAARRAGYSSRTARSIGQENLTKPDISAAIRRTVAAQTERAGLRADDAWRELWCVASSNIGEFFDRTGPAWRLRPANEIPESALRAVKHMRLVTHTTGTGTVVMSLTIAFWNKCGALTFILKAMGELDHMTQPGVGSAHAALVLLHHKDKSEPLGDEGLADAWRSLKDDVFLAFEGGENGRDLGGRQEHIVECGRRFRWRFWEMIAKKFFVDKFYEIRIGGQVRESFCRNPKLGR
jgi:phage terminase small subunit